jgi:hypothetical protein
MPSSAAPTRLVAHIAPQFQRNAAKSHKLGFGKEKLRRAKSKAELRKLNLRSSLVLIYSCVSLVFF